MFTGIVEEIGTVAAIDLSGRAPLVIRCNTVLEGTRIGDSIAVDGVCLTVVSFDATSFRADVQPITLRRSSLGTLRLGDGVNLERSAATGQRIGGHYVQGHVDDIGRIVSATGEGPSLIVRIAAPEHVRRYVVERGYIAVDGASLTVAALYPDGFEVSLVYHTRNAITLGHKRPGAMVNLEADVIGKYVERLLGGRATEGVSMDLLARAGYL